MKFKSLIPISIAGALILGILAYEARLGERISNRAHGSKALMLEPEFTSENHSLILQVCEDSLRNLAGVDPLRLDYCRTEKLIRELFRPNELSHSLNRLATGLLVTQTADSPEAIAIVEFYCSQYINTKGDLIRDIRAVDHFAIGSIFLEMHSRTGEKKYLAGASQVAQQLLEKRPRTSLDTLPYRASNPETMLVDDKAMICPFLIRYGAEHDDPDALNLGIHQLVTYLKVGMNPVTGFPSHGFHIPTETRIGSDTWLRGIGWLAMGCAESLSFLPREHESREPITEAFVKLLQSLRTLQRPGDCWAWDANNASAQPDTSGTAMVGYAIEIAIRDGFLEPSWSEVSENALSGIISHTLADGTVTQALGGSQGAGHYPAFFGPSNTTQGPSLALFSLVMERKNQKSKTSSQAITRP